MLALLPGAPLLLQLMLLLPMWHLRWTVINCHVIRRQAARWSWRCYWDCTEDARVGCPLAPHGVARPSGSDKGRQGLLRLLS